MTSDRHALATAFGDLKARSFPGHPTDPDLAEWALELSELDGHIAGLAVTALGSSHAHATHSHDVAEHALRLTEIRVVGDDERVYGECLAYVQALARVEDALGGRLANGG